MDLGWKIECDALDDGDVECIARIAFDLIQRLEIGVDNFIGVPRGGVRLADAMQALAGPRGQRKMVVDDVLTTGRSVAGWMAKEQTDLALVIFARRPCPSGVYALFQVNWLLDPPGDHVASSSHGDGW